MSDHPRCPSTHDTGLGADGHYTVTCARAVGHKGDHTEFDVDSDGPRPLGWFEWDNPSSKEDDQP